mmetsp:Transcript_26600/g.42164  ORF Transcript_26600/g.42164 Transcript_26600/m.42164 type:complete len:133 (+) Transcript_26600:476-874(+)
MPSLTVYFSFSLYYNYSRNMEATLSPAAAVASVSNICIGWSPPIGLYAISASEVATPSLDAAAAVPETTALSLLDATSSGLSSISTESMTEVSTALAEVLTAAVSVVGLAAAMGSPSRFRNCIGSSPNPKTS